MSDLTYRLVDVFTSEAFGGNQLPVVMNAGGLTSRAMLAITREFRQFETVFLERLDDRSARVRIFDLAGELPFAGHPLIGAAAVLHAEHGQPGSDRWRFVLPEREVFVTVSGADGPFKAVLDQGEAAPGVEIPDRASWYRRFGLDPAAGIDELPIEVGSTGLRYLVVPVTAGGLEGVRILHDMDRALADVDAEFAVLFDPVGREIRHWNNDGVLEDSATGSAAGVVAAYATAHGVFADGEWTTLSQGRFTQRPSRIHVRASLGDSGAFHVEVGGDVVLIGHGTLTAAL